MRQYIKGKWEQEHLRYYFIYTICFTFTALIVYSWYFLRGDFLVWKVDGWAQYYKALVYYSQYLRDIVKSLLFEHKIAIPHFDFALGEGGDVLQILHYYGIGDPFVFLGIFVPVRFMYLYYTFCVLFRLYLAGIVFSVLCFQTTEAKDTQGTYGILAGAMAYVFSYWAIESSCKHPFFLNAMIWLPLLIIGVEAIIKGKRPYLFIVTVMLSAFSNFYFFYVLVLLLIFYVLLRAVFLYRNHIAGIVVLVCKIGLAAVLGVLMAAVVLAPMCAAFLTDVRAASERDFYLLYPLRYYLSLPAAFLTTQSPSDLNMGYAAPVLLAVLLMFCKRRQYVFLKALFVTGGIMILCPLFGQAMNGFSYMSSRWAFAFALTAAYILVRLWPCMMQLSFREVRYLVLCLSIYFILCLFMEPSRVKAVFVAIVICMLVVFSLLPDLEVEHVRYHRSKQAIVLTAVLGSVILNSFWRNSVSEEDRAEGMGRWISEILTVNETQTIADMAKREGVDEFYRYSGTGLTTNANMIAGISSTQFYWSLAIPKVTEYRTKLNMIESSAYNYEGYDDRAAINSLAAVRFYSIPWDDQAGVERVPYGFAAADEESAGGGYRIYQNQYVLPLAYTYDSYIPEDVWDKYSSVEKQEAMLQTAVLDEAAGALDEAVPILTSQICPYVISCMDENVVQQGNSFVVTSDQAKLQIVFEGCENSETYVEITGLEFEPSSKYDLYFGEQKYDPTDLYDMEHYDMLDKSSQQLIKKERFLYTPPQYADLTFKEEDIVKSLRYYQREHPQYTDRHDFAVNLGYSEKPRTVVEVTFSNRGIYSFDSLNIICQPMSAYAEQIEKLQEDTMQDVVIGRDCVSGTITLDAPKLLCFTIPYSGGWKAYVDGKEARLYQTNIKNMAVILDEGVHSVRLEYETPMLEIGLWLSIGGLLIFLVFIILYEKNTKSRL